MRYLSAYLLITNFPLVTKIYLGINIFQYKVPSHFRQINPKLKVLFRKSLRTRIHSDALKKSRKLVVYMEDLIKKYFDSPEAFGKAMVLLMIDENITEKYKTFV